MLLKGRKQEHRVYAIKCNALPVQYQIHAQRRYQITLLGSGHVLNNLPRVTTW